MNLENIERRFYGILLFIILIFPIVTIIIKYYDATCISNILKDLGTALAIISALFSFTLSWLTDSKGYLSKIYEIKEAQELYDKLNKQSLKLFVIWERAFFISLTLLAIAYLLGTFSPKPIESLKELFCSCYFYVFTSAICLVAWVYLNVYMFFSIASEILKLRNDLEKEICRYETKERNRI